MSSEYLNNKTFENIIAKFQQAKRNRAKHELIAEDIKTTKTRLKNEHEWLRMSWLLRDDDYLGAQQEFTACQKELATAFYTLSENIVRYARFSLIDQDDAIQEGVMVCFEKIDKFDPQKGKAFNYITTIIWNHLRQLYRTSRNYNELKRKFMNHLESQLSQHLPQNKKASYKWHNSAYAEEKS